MHFTSKLYYIFYQILHLQTTTKRLMLKDTYLSSGIKIGEIGTKLGMNATNNGFLGFENVRIPREHMLMKNSQVMGKRENKTFTIDCLRKSLTGKIKVLIVRIFRY